MTIDSGIVLYYPYVQILDENLFKVSLLYWDGVRRIYPKNYDFEDIEYEKIALDNGLLINTDPEIYIQDKDLERRVLEKFRFALKHEYFQNKINKFQNKIFSSYYFHSSKLPQKLWDEFRTYNLLDNSLEIEGFEHPEPFIADFCFLEVVNYISSRIKCNKLSNSGRYFELLNYLSYQANNESIENSNVMNLLSLAFNFPSPDQLADIPIKKIIKFNKESRDERRLFRQNYNKIIDSIRVETDENALKDKLNTLNEDLNQSYKNLFRKMDDLKIQTFNNCLKTVLPTSLENAVKILSLVGIASDLIAEHSKYRVEYQEKIKNDPINYLLSMEKAGLINKR